MRMYAALNQSRDVVINQRILNLGLYAGAWGLAVAFYRLTYSLKGKTFFSNAGTVFLSLGVMATLVFAKIDAAENQQARAQQIVNR